MTATKTVSTMVQTAVLLRIVTTRKLNSVVRQGSNILKVTRGVTKRAFSMAAVTETDIDILVTSKE